MSKIIATAAIRGAHHYVTEAETKLNQALEAFGPDKKVAFPNTAYYLPLILALRGLKVETLKDCQEALNHARSLLPPLPAEQLWLPYLGDALDAGVATLIAEEIIEALKYVNGYKPEPPWLGFTDDAILRTQGIKLVDGRMPGFAACVGALPTNRDAVELARALQERNILVFMAGASNGRSMAEQLAEEGIDMNWDTFLVPYGKDVSTAVYALNFAARAAMTFGGIKPGSFDAARQILLYNKERVHAFVLALGSDPNVNGGQLISDEKYATAAGAINFGFPVIADVSIPQILPRGICTYEHVVSGISLDKIVHKAIEVRGLKLKIAKIPIPVPYGAGFEGERVRKENLYVEFGGKYSTAFELLRARPMDEVEDGKIELIGPDLDQAEEGGAMPLAVLVDVAGRNLKADFEPVLERRIHHFISCINGVMHIGQRDIPWVRLSKEAYEKGFRLKHYGEVLVAKFKDDFGAIVDKVQVKLVTDQAQVDQLLKEAREIYRQRDERVMGMKDEDVDTFYSCILCVPAGEEIVLADGSFVPVEKLIERAVESDGVQVLSWDGCGLTPRPVEELFINPAPAELIRITLKNGNALTLTPNHKVLVDRGDLEWVPARELKAGDGLLSAQTTGLNGAGESIKLIDLLPDDLLVQDEGFLAELREALLRKFGSWAVAAQKLQLDYHRLYAAFYENSNPKVHRRRLTLAEIKRICSTLGLSWDTVKTKIRRLGTLVGSTLHKQALDEELLYAAGLVASDGCVLRRGHGVSLQFTNAEPALIERFNQIMTATFGAKPRVYRVPPYKSSSRDGKLVVRARREVLVSRVNDQLAGRLMHGLGIGRGPDRREKWSGEIISTLPPKMIAAFLRGLFDGDGHVAGSRLLLTTRSFKEAQHIVLLLKKLGIHAYIARIKRGFQVGTKRHTDFFAWREKIGSEHPAKRAKLEAATFSGDRNHVSRTDVLPRRCGRLLHQIMIEANGQLQVTKLPVDYQSLRAWMAGKVRPSREKLRLVVEAIQSKVNSAQPALVELVGWCNSPLHIERVKRLERIKSTDRAVYNFSVSSTHNYMVNGVVVKNCQSYAPNHVCIVTPQRLGLCGAYTWLDCGASYEMDPHGPNKPVTKGICLDPVLGEWQGVNEYVRVASNGNLERVSMYSIMQDPQTSCVVGETELIIDGVPTPLGEFIEQHRGGERYRDSAALTLREGKTRLEPLVALQRFDAPEELIRLETKSGAQLVLTKDHELAVDRPDGMRWVRADQIKAGERLIALKHLRLPGQLPAVVELLPKDFRSRRQLPKSLSPELFYLLGLIASDGCITPRGRYERIIHFVNTDEELVQQFTGIYKELFPDCHLARKVKSAKPTTLRGRTIKPTRPCFQLSSNNSVLGLLAERLGLRVGSQGHWELGRLASLPEAHIAAFLAGVFDGDGSVRLRQYAGKWDIAEGYVCIADERAARHLQLLLRRLGIIGNLNKSGSVWKIVMHGANLRKFAEVIPAKHPEKQAVLASVRQLPGNGRLDKTQEEVLPYYVGQALAQLPACHEVLSPSTLYYYQSGRSRPVAANVQKVLEAAPETGLLRAALETDYFLDTVVTVETVSNTGKDRYERVYCLTLADIHCFFANTILIKNCGCFECIVAVLPETNGVMVASREYQGETPIGMTFSTMAGEVGGGVQTPGFLGVGKLYLTSEKFISAEGGIRRLVWMPSELKEEIKERLQKRLEEIGMPELFDKIATEKDATTTDELMAFLQKVGHPVLEMEAIIA